MTNILFLCVANSARSQMAEGLARAYFGERASIQSAGSVPTTVHPMAIAVLEEQGIDICAQESTCVDLVDPSTVDVVVTLCSDEVCPAFLGEARRLHWPLPDPAAPTGTVVEQLGRFRAVRDVIVSRLPELSFFCYPAANFNFSRL